MMVMVSLTCYASWLLSGHCVVMAESPTYVEVRSSAYIVVCGPCWGSQTKFDLTTPPLINYRATEHTLLN